MCHTLNKSSKVFPGLKWDLPKKLRTSFLKTEHKKIKLNYRIGKEIEGLHSHRQVM